MNQRYALPFLLAGLAVSSPGLADTATLVAETTIIDNIPIGTIGSEDGFGNPGFAVNRGDGVTTGFIDAAVLSYDFGTVTSVSKAELTIDVDIIFDDAGMSPTIELFTYADDGTIELTDIFLGAGVVRDSFTYSVVQMRTIDVTAAVNEALQASRFVGFRFENLRSPFELPILLEGVHFFPIHLEFDTDCGTVYCDANPMNAADIAISGCDCSAGSIMVSLLNAPVPDGQFCYLLIGQGNSTITDPPGAVGDLCLAGSCIGDYTLDVGVINGGMFDTDILNASSGGGGGGIPNCGGNLCNPPGQTFNFQYWYRDGMSPSRFSKALSATFN